MFLKIFMFIGFACLVGGILGSGIQLKEGLPYGWSGVGWAFSVFIFGSVLSQIAGGLSSPKKSKPTPKVKPARPIGKAKKRSMAEPLATGQMSNAAKRILGQASASSESGSANSNEKELAEADAKKLLVDFLEFNTMVMAHESGEQPFHACPISLKLAVEPSNGKFSAGWIGGNPSMPKDIAWPQIPIEKEPADSGTRDYVFYAQINCSAFPPELWGGMGPREGWLLFFASPKSFSDVVMMHNQELGDERAAPSAPDHYGGTDDPRVHYNEVYGDKNNIPPKWPLIIEPVNVEADPGYQDTYNLKKKWHEAGREYAKQLMVDRRLKPVTWQHLSECFYSYDTYLARRLESITKTAKSQQGYFREDFKAEELEHWLQLSSGYRKLQDAIARSYQEFEEVKNSVLSNEKAVPFDAAIFYDVMAALSKIDTSDWTVGDKPYKDANLGQHDEPSMQFFHFMEVWARVNFASDSECIPSETRGIFERYWHMQSNKEVAFMGGEPHDGFPYSQMQNPVFMLELPSSELLGWSFGDLSKFGIFMPPEALANGDWDKAWGDILN